MNGICSDPCYWKVILFSNFREDVGTKSTNKWNFSHRHSFVDRTAASGVTSGGAGAEGSEEHYQTLAQHPLYPNGSRKCANGAKTTNVNTNQQPSDASAAGLLFDDQVLDRNTIRTMKVNHTDQELCHECL